MLAPTKSTAEKKNAVAAANLVIKDFTFVMFENLRFHFLILYFISNCYPFLPNGHFLIEFDIFQGKMGILSNCNRTIPFVARHF